MFPCVEPVKTAVVQHFVMADKVVGKCVMSMPLFDCTMLYPQCTCEICTKCVHHYNDVRMGAIESQITSLTIVYSTVYSGTYQRKHQSSASLAFVRRVQRWPVNSPHKGPVTRKRFPFDDVIMILWGIWGNWPQTRVSQAPKSSYYTYRLTLRQLLQLGPKLSPLMPKQWK